MRSSFRAHRVRTLARPGPQRGWAYGRVADYCAGTPPAQAPVPSTTRVPVLLRELGRGSGAFGGQGQAGGRGPLGGSRGTRRNEVQEGLSQRTGSFAGHGRRIAGETRTALAIFTHV